MKNILYCLLFKIISFAFEMIMALQTLFNDFIRHIYIPLITATNNPQKIIDDISIFSKKPQDQITMVIDVKISKSSDIARTALKIIRYQTIIVESIGPKSFNCFLSTDDLDDEEVIELKKHLNKFKHKKSKLKLIFGAQIDYTQKLKVQKSKITPLIISFCSYPSVCGLPPHLLMGAQISFNPPILKTVDYDIFTAFQRYSTSEQRKGK